MVFTHPAECKIEIFFYQLSSEGMLKAPELNETNHGITFTAFKIDEKLKCFYKKKI